MDEPEPEPEPEPYILQDRPTITIVSIYNERQVPLGRFFTWLIITGCVLVMAGMLTWMIVTIAHHYQVQRHGHMMWCDAPNLTVSIGGGRGHFSSISAAVEAAPDLSPWRFCIHVKQGRYIEDVYINENKTNLVFVGDGIGKTIIAGTSDCRSLLCSIQRATLWVRGDSFMAADISVENNVNGSAVAIVNRSDKSVLLRCRFSGQHGAVYAYVYRQLYRECQIDGAGFLITGELAMAVFQNCSLSLVATAPESRFVIAALSRDEDYEEGVFVFHQSVLSISGGTTTNPPPLLGLALLVSTSYGVNT